MAVVGISIVFTLLVAFPYLAGILQKLPGTVFAGAVHYPLDYYYYLSYMAQGRDRWLTAINLQTSEPLQPIFYHWIYVLSGKLFSLAGISTTIGYQILVVGCTVLLLFVSYRLICKLLPTRSERTIAFTLFLASNAWPYIERTQTGFVVRYFYAWYNYGEPFIRFSSLPHHLLAQSVLLASILLMNHAVKIPGNAKRILLAAFYGFLLASTQTPLVAVVGLTYGIVWITDIVHNLGKLRSSLSSNLSFGAKLRFFTRWNHIVQFLSSPLIPILFAFSAGAFPYFFYIKNVLSHPPYSMFAAWEATQHVRITLWQFFLVNGPIVLFGIAGLPIFFTKRSTARIALFTATCVSWIIFFSPLPVMIRVLNVRFLSVIPTLFLSVSSALLIHTLARSIKPASRLFVYIGVTILILAFTLPATVQQMITRTTFRTDNAYLYLPTTVTDIYNQVTSLTTPRDTCLVVWPFNVTFAALTGRRTYLANEFATINFQAKQKQVTQFFDTKTPLSAKINFLKSNAITCLLTYSFTSDLPLSVLTPAAANSYMTLYMVRKSN